MLHFCTDEMRTAGLTQRVQVLTALRPTFFWGKERTPTPCCTNARAIFHPDPRRQCLWTAPRVRMRFRAVPALKNSDA